MTSIRGVSTSASSKSALAVAVAALALLTASEAGAATSMAQSRSSIAAAPQVASTPLFSSGFESNTSGASLTTANGGSWAKDGNGTATVTSTAALVESGTQAAALTPGSSTAGTWVYRSNTAIADPASTAQPIITSSVGLNITSPASGTANRSVFLGLQTYDAAVDMLASAYLVWNGGNNITGLSANELVLQFESATDSFGYTFGAVTSAQLASVGYFDVSIALNYATGEATFGWGNTTLGHAFAIEDTTLSFSATDFSDADLYYQRGATGGTLPRLAADNYSITTSALAPVPEPETWALMLGGLGVLGMLARRRRAG